MFGTRLHFSYSRASWMNTTRSRDSIIIRGMSAASQRRLFRR
jgi:hypothetical protein